MPDALERLFAPSINEPWFPTSEQRLLAGKDIPAHLSSRLNRDTLISYLEMAELPNQWHPALIACAERIDHDEILKMAWVLSYRLLIEDHGYDPLQFRHWPLPVDRLGESAVLFYALLALCAIPDIQSRHADMNIPEEITRNTCRSLGSKLRDYGFFHRSPGIETIVLYWIRRYTDGKVVRIGRLEYESTKAPKNFQLCRNPVDGTTLLEMRSPTTGNMVAVKADGSGECELQRIPDSWYPMVQEGDPLLEIHIPGGGGLDLLTVQDSLIKARDFYAAHSDGLAVRGFISHTWIISPDTDALYDADSNLMRLRDQVYLYPVATRKVEGLRFIFGTASTSPGDWPRNTSVQRRLAKHLLAGGSFRLWGMIIPTRDIDDFGSKTPRYP